MRNLTIKRTKSFVGCLAKMKIYIEDPAASEIMINNVPCRKIGDLKNGEEKTFSIEEHSASIFVIADRLSKNYCNEYYMLPEGQEDIFLSGKNKFNPANGNAFRFDNNDSAEVIENRKKGTRKGILILAIVLLAAWMIGLIAGSVIGFVLPSNGSAEAKVFSSNGMNVTLTDAFQKMDMANYTVAYGSEEIAVFALKEAFSLADGSERYTLKQYADLVLQSNGLDASVLETDGDLTCFQYEFTNSETNETYRYFTYMYKADDAFWLVQFATLTENAEKYTQQISEWAKSVTFSD